MNKFIRHCSRNPGKCSSARKGIKVVYFFKRRQSNYFSIWYILLTWKIQEDQLKNTFKKEFNRVPSYNIKHKK